MEQLKKISEIMPEFKTGLTLETYLQQQGTGQIKTKQAYGIAAQYKNQLQRCAFKLIIYWKVKKNGVPYADHELKAGDNLKKIPSFDFDNDNRINHDQAYGALVDYVYENAHKMLKAILVLNNYSDSTEHWIYSFNVKNLIRSDRREVHFKEKDINGNIRFDYYEGQPIRIDKMRFYEK